MITHIIALLLGAAIAFSAAWEVQESKYERKIAVMNVKAAEKESDAKDALVKANDIARLAEQALNERYQRSLNEARTRENTLRHERDLARIESDRLREQNADAARRLAKAPPAAVLDYALAAGELLSTCGRGYQELAGKADGHASDVRTIIDAWPTSPPR